MKKIIASVLFVSSCLALPGSALADAFKVGTIEIDHLYSRAMLPGAKVGGGYLNITNNGADDRLVSATAERAGTVQLHEMKMDGGIMVTRASSKPVDAGHDMSSMPPDWVRQDQVALLIYPAMTALDMVAPQYAFASLMGATVHLVAKTRDPIVSDTGLTILPTSTFDECPRDLDVICVPGGSTGTLAAMQDDTTLDFLADRGSRAKFVTSVCTGSLLLGAAGLLRGYKATSHWATRELLKEFGAVPTDQRVVIDRNRLTGGGVTAGMDLGLTLVAKLRDDFYAQGVQLMAEYAPQPPFNAGTPATAPEPVFKIMDEMFIDFRARATEVARRVVQGRERP